MWTMLPPPAASSISPAESAMSCSIWRSSLAMHVDRRTGRSELVRDAGSISQKSSGCGRLSRNPWDSRASWPPHGAGEASRNRARRRGVSTLAPPDILSPRRKPRGLLAGQVPETGSRRAHLDEWSHERRRRRVKSGIVALRRHRDVHHQVLAEQSAGVPRGRSDPAVSWKLKSRRTIDICAKTITTRACRSWTSGVWRVDVADAGCLACSGSMTIALHHRVGDERAPSCREGVGIVV